MPERARDIGRWVAGALFLLAGVGHLTTQREEFRAQVPEWFPLVSEDAVVLASGVVEIALGVALIALPRYKVAVGWTVAAFLVAVFPGNIAQYVEHEDAFGLDTEAERLIRLPFQPLFIVGVLWCTGAWRDFRARRAHPRDEPSGA